MLSKSVSSAEGVKLVTYGFLCLFLSTGIFLFTFWKAKKGFPVIDKGTLVIVLIFIFLSSETLHEVPIYDSGAYYAWSISKMAARFNYTLENIGDYCFAGHLSVGYSLLVLIGELLIPGTAMGVHIVNIALASVSIFCFHGILKVIMQEEAEDKRLLGTAVYAFAPYLLG